MAAAGSGFRWRPATTANCSRSTATEASGVGAGSPWGAFRRINAACSESVRNPMPFAAVAQRIRLFSLSIGQLTFASFMLLLAMIVMTSVASVVSIRHIDTTFAELQRLESLGDVSEEIDRRMNELRLAARDFVTGPGTSSDQVGAAASA